MKGARGFPLGPVSVLGSGVALVAVAIAVANTGGPRGAQVACAFTGVTVLVIGVLWLAVAVGTWKTVKGPWWSGATGETNEIARVARLLDGLARDESRWASPSMRTALALHRDNSKLCARMDHVAYRASSRGRGDPPDELDAMWRSLLDGRSRLRELCGEMAAMAGRAMAAVPVETIVTDERIVSDLTSFTDRINALDAARRELEFPPPPDPPPASGAGPTDLLQLLSSRAPDLVQPAAALLIESRRRKEEANRSITRWKEQVEQLPAETPAADRDRFTAARQEQWAAMQQYVARIHQAEEAVLRAARNLSPPPPPAPPPPKEYERGSVEAAEGMINALKEMNRRSET